jgi:hypothetical protein
MQVVWFLATAAINVTTGGKRAKFETFRGFLFSKDVDTVAQLNICAPNIVKTCRIYPYLHAEGWSVRDLNAIPVFCYSTCPVFPFP